ncbi:MAG: ribose-phosphate pyrophosphokinase [Paludibacteraceae bacterium]|jgi:ribose-phosphate pyrophosphokinase|nr:ribose-phosphate pyrophosphokinase [Paludibacteraceae bacterium]
MEESKQFKIFAGSKGEALAQGICAELGCELGKLRIDRFSDGEFCTYFEESVRGQSVYLVQSTCPSSDNLMELLLMIDAAKRASAAKVIAVIPYFGWARQDRKDKPRVSIGAKVVANMLQTAGADRVITVDLHADQIQGFFDIPVDHIYGSNVLAPYIANLNLKKLIVASPDVGGSKRASNFAKKLHVMTDREVPMVICYKNRPDFNKVSEIRVLGDVYGKDVVLYDDIADTAGTLCKAAEVMKEGGAKSVRAVVTHGVLSGEACKRIEESVLEELVCTDSIPFDPSRCSKLHVESLAVPIAQTIRAIQNHTSVSETNIR